MKPKIEIVIKKLIEKLKALRIYAVRCSSFFYTGIKESKWENIHFEFEIDNTSWFTKPTWFTSGDEYLWEFTERWIYFLGLPIWRLQFKAENKGRYEY